MLSKKIETALNEQIAKEAYAANYYLSMASWCEKSGLRGCAGFMYQQSDEELEHMMKLFRYVNSAGGHSLVSALKEPPAAYKSIAQVFELALEHEINVTKSINRLVELCFEEKDYSSFNFLQWYVAEQHEEEKLFNSILDLVKIAGTDGRGLLLLDNEITKLRDKEEEEDED